MKYLVIYKARRINTKMHTYTQYGKRKFFDNIEEAEIVVERLKNNYNVAICNSKYEVIKKIKGEVM